MIYRFLTLVIMAIFPLLSFGSSYASYEMVAMDKDSLKKVEEVISSLNLISMDGGHGEGLGIFGINQLFVNNDFSKMVTFKYDVKGIIKLNEWEQLDNGRVYHYQANGKINAIFFRGIDVEQADKIIAKLKSISITNFKFNFSLFNTAHASDDCERYTPTEIEFPMMEKISSSVIFKSLLGCISGVEKGIDDSLLGSGKTAVAAAESVWGGLKAMNSEMVSLWTNPSQKLNQYYNGIVKAALVTKDIISFVGDFIINPEAASITLKKAYGPAADKIIGIFSQLKNLPTPVMLEMACATISGLGIDALIAYLTVGVGAVKLALTFTRITKQANTLGKIFKTLDNLYKAGSKNIALSKEKIELFTRRIVQDKIPEEDLDYINNFLGDSNSTDSTAMEALSCYIK